jgi:[acyl-carrier-protein] S-malonyltransferase
VSSTVVQAPFVGLSDTDSLPLFKLGVLFPGQGAQQVGMGQWLSQASPTVAHIFSTLEKVTGEPILSLCLNGPEETLKNTRFTQPALLGVSLAAWTVWKEAMDQALGPHQSTLLDAVLTERCFAAGHSLGEFSALYAAGVLDLPTVCHIVNQRALLMSEAKDGSMAVVLGLTANAVNTALQPLVANLNNNQVLCVANDNTPEQVVISGSPQAVAEAGPVLKMAGAKRVLPLSVSGAFHSPLMRNAAKGFASVLNPVPFAHAQFPIITNVDAALTTQADHFKAKLAQQLDHGVCWSATMARLFTEQGVTHIIEFGSGTVLSGMIKKCYPHVTLFNVADEASLQATVSGLVERLTACHLLAH